LADERTQIQFGQKRPLKSPLRRRSVEAVGAEDRELPDALLERAAERREDAMSARCAWCGRYRVGERWLPAGELPEGVVAASVSHGICPDCVAALRDAGKSA
jgi:hypothetical protein